ncbi:hypothetical protein [Microvirga calopogonii]|uniref:hypothetical protein n=1 Tax=Microvirga calopogonii TaxID=2078013 RepID=UPI000E0CD7F0|nr:hypothetical protein [Microvirga calopogonii]
MQAMPPSDVPTVTLPLPATATSDQWLDTRELQTLGERLRLAYGPVEAPLPARLAELVERLARCEQIKHQVGGG